MTSRNPEQPGSHGSSTGNRPIVVLDANVLYSQVLSDYHVHADGQGLIDVRWSSAILDEMTRNQREAARKKAKTPEETVAREARVDRLREYIDKQYPDKSVDVRDEHYEPFRDMPMKDRDDRHVVATAVAAKADLLCTNNVDDFPPEVMAKVGIPVVKPDALLSGLARSNPTEMVTAHQRTVDWTPRSTHRATLDTLRRAQANQTADKMEGLLAPLGDLNSRADLSREFQRTLDQLRLAQPSMRARQRLTPALRGDRLRGDLEGRVTQRHPSDVQRGVLRRSSGIDRD